MTTQNNTEKPDTGAASGREERLVRLLNDAEKYMSTLPPSMVEHMGPIVIRNLISELREILKQGEARCLGRFIHETSNDWGYIRDIKLNRLISVVDAHPEEIIRQCRIDGSDPHQKRVDELLLLLNH